MKTMNVLATSAVLLAATIQVHADRVWNNSSFDGLWTNSANWGGDGLGNTIISPGNLALGAGTTVLVDAGSIVSVDGDFYGPEWGMTLNVDGGSLTHSGFAFAPVGATVDPSAINVNNGGYLEVGELLLGDNWWFTDAPAVDVSISGSNSVIKARGWMWCAGHIDLHDGTLDVSGSMNLDTAGKGYLKINIEAGHWIIRNSDGVGGTADTGLLTKINDRIATDQIVAYGGLGELSITNVGYGYGITAVAPPFVITGSPTGASGDPSPTVEAVITDLSSTFDSAVLYLNDNPVATNSSPAGTTNTISYEATGLVAGTYTGKVIVSGTPESFTNQWTFEVLPFTSVDVSPTGWTTTNSVTLQAVIVAGASSVSNTTTLYLDGSNTLATVTGSTTGTISYVASGLSHGVHTGKVVAVGSPAGVVTNEWTFQVVLEESRPISIVHHWDFDDGMGTTVTDSEGGLDGSIMGTNYAWVPQGLDLFGGGQSGTWAATNSGSYVDLPNNMLGALSNSVSFEATYVIDNNQASWLRVWDFGGSVGGEDVSDTGAEGVFLTSRGSAAGGPRVSYSTNNPAVGVFVLDSTIAASTVTVTHVVWVYDGDTGMNKLYHNGALVDAEVSPAAPLSVIAGMDVNNWLGRSQWAGDGMFDGKLYDLRMYNGIMTPAEVTTHYNAAINIGGPGFAPYITSISVAGSSVTLSWTADSLGSYSILRKTDLTAPGWNVVVSNLPAGNLTTNVAAGGSDQEFYQVKGE